MSTEVSLQKYYRYLITERHDQLNPIVRGKFLFQEFICMAWARIEDQKLKYFRSEKMQAKLRSSS